MKIITPEEWNAKEASRPQHKRTRCTKYQLVTCLRTYYTELLQQLRSAYSTNTDLQFYWNTVQDLDRNNADFKSAAQQLGITDAQLDEIFAKIEGEEPEAIPAQ